MHNHVHIGSCHSYRLYISLPVVWSTGKTVLQYHEQNTRISTHSIPNGSPCESVSLLCVKLLFSTIILMKCKVTIKIYKLALLRKQKTTDEVLKSEAFVVQNYSQSYRNRR